MRGAQFGAVTILAFAAAALGARAATSPTIPPPQRPAPAPERAPTPMAAAGLAAPAAKLASPASSCTPRAPGPNGDTGCSGQKPAAPSPAPAGYVIRRVLDTHGAIPFGTWFWDEADVPAGPIVVTVDTKASVLSIFRGGYEIGTTAVIYGDDGMPTPLGVFPITQKDARHVSNLYHAPMPYMLRLTNDGVSIHGSPIAADYATHGCIGVPVAFARRLFGATRLGDRVIVTHGETLSNGARIKAI